MYDEKNSPSVIAIIVVKIYKDKVLTPNLVSEISSDIEMMLHTIEKKIKGIIINFNADINKSDAAVKILDIIKPAI